jgi:hypothetical protein
MSDYWVNPLSAGANDGSSFADAWVDFNSFIAVAAAGDRCFVANTQVLAAAFAISGKPGTTTSYIRVIGVNASGVDDGTLAIWDADSAATNVLTKTGSNYWHFENIRFTGAVSYAFAGSSDQYNRFINCQFDNNGNYVINSSSYLVIRNCLFINNSSRAMTISYSFIKNSAFIGNGTTFVTVFTGLSSVMENCLLHDNHSGVWLQAPYVSIVGCVLDGHLNNEAVRCTSNSWLMNTKITNHAAANAVTGDWSLRVENCNFYNPLATNDISAPGFEIDKYTLLTGDNPDDGYNDRAADDFNPKDGANGAPIANPIGLESELVNVAYLTQGFPREYGGGGGGGGRLVDAGLVR